MNIAREADWNIRWYGCRDAIVWRDRVWSNVELHDASCRLATALVAAGVAPGSRVAVALNASVEYAIAVDALLRAGGVFVALSPRAPKALVERILADSRAEVVILSRALFDANQWMSAGRLCVVADDLDAPEPTLSLWSCVRLYPPSKRPVFRKPEDLAVIWYSSGTTGIPHGVGQTHGQLTRWGGHGRRPASIRSRVGVIREAKRRAQFRAPQVELSPLPLSHGFGGSQLVRRHFSPALLVLLERFEPHKVLSAVQSYRVTRLSLIPSFVESLIAVANLKQYDLSSLRQITVGGAPSRPELLESLEALVGAPVVNQYGMTEGGGTSTAFSARRKAGSVGQPFPGCAIRIVDESGAVLPAGQTGEVQVRIGDGKTEVLYVGQRSAAPARSADGWRPTGDIGYVDSDGDLFLVTRKNDLIIQGGANIVPDDVEQILRTVPGVADAAVVGVPSAFLGEEAVACIVRTPNLQVSESDILTACARQLDGSKMPVSVSFVDELPRTDLGKLKRRELALRINSARVDTYEAPFVSGLLTRPRSAQRSAIGEIVDDATLKALQVTHPETAAVNPALGFIHQGLTSLGMARLAGSLSERLGCPLEATALFTHTTPAALADFLLDKVFAQPSAFEPAPGGSVAPGARGERGDDPVAIIGMACHLPGANTPEEYWRMLCAGVDGTSDAPSDRFPADWLSSATTVGRPRRGAFIDGPFDFDEAFFGLSPLEAARLRPAQRLLMRVAWEAIEDAAQAPASLASTTTGVYIGAMGGDARLAGMTSYWLNLRGPSVTVDTACSASLVAVHIAAEALRNGECEVALAGGVHIIESVQAFDGAAALQLLSPDGRCRAFDAAADGIGMGEGCGIVALKRLADATANGDRIIALIRGGAVNHDGRSSSLTAPNGAAQRVLLDTALRRAAVEPAAIGYVEAHGTGTRLGDPVEVRALAEVLCNGRKQPLTIGSVKTNIGHTQGAAGVAGLIKAALCVERALIPPTLHFQQLNPLLKQWSTSVNVPVQLEPWPAVGRPRLAGVTSMGLYGTNAHVIVEQPPVVSPEASEARAPSLLCISAIDDEQRRVQVERMALYLGLAPSDYSDVCYTAAVGRRHFPSRAAILAETCEEARALCVSYAQTGTVRGVMTGTASSRPRVVFLFTGQGAYRARNGAQLWATEPVFREALKTCDAILQPQIGCSIVELLYGESSGGSAEQLEDPIVAQPMLVAFEWALSRLWHSWGIAPDAVLGHSLGEYAAACVAGMVELEPALTWVAERARLTHRVSARGAMAAVAATVAELSEWLAMLPDARTLGIAAINGPRQSVVSGDADELAALLARLRDAHVECRILPVRAAYHSALMEPILDPFAKLTENIPLRQSAVDFVSSWLGRTIQPGEAATPGYWRRQMREPVQFASAVRWCIEQGYRTFLEIGPDAVLTSLGRLNTTDRVDVTWAASLRGSRDERAQMLQALGALYVQGANPDWEAFHRPVAHRRVSLPTYPFRRQFHRWRGVVSLAAREVPRPSPPAGVVAACIVPSAVPTSRQSAAESSDTDAAAVVKRILDEVLPAHGPIDTEQNLLETGLDSLRVIDLLTLAQRRFGVTCTTSEFLARPTIAGLAAMLVERQSSDPPTTESRIGGGRAQVIVPLRADPVAIIRAGGAAVPLFCMHPAGGDISCYLRLRDILPSDRPIYAIESRALADPQREHRSLELLASDYATLMQVAAPDGPYEICGWSMGALIGHAVAGELERRGARVLALVLIDPPGPAGSLKRQKPADVSVLLSGILANLPRSAADPVAAAQEIVRDHPLASPGTLYAECVAAGLITRDIMSAATFERALELRKRHHVLVRKYRPRMIDTPVSMWWALEGTRPQFRGGLSSRGIRARGLPGNHFTVMAPSNLRVIFQSSAPYQVP